MGNSKAMSEDLLFPAESVQSMSPRLRWMKKWGVKTHHAPHCEESPWCAWFAVDEDLDAPGIPLNPDACGYGDSEQEAIECLACDSKTPLWNEAAP